MNRRTRTCYSFAEWSNATDMYVPIRESKQTDGHRRRETTRQRGAGKGGKRPDQAVRERGVWGVGVSGGSRGGWWKAEGIAAIRNNTSEHTGHKQTFDGRDM